MEKLISIDSLYNSLKDIIESRQNVEKVREIIIQLHFSVQEVKLTRKLSEEIDFDTLDKIAMYLLSVLTNITSNQMQEYVKGFYVDGLNIAGLIFELTTEIRELNAVEKHYYFFYCSVCYSLAGKEASSAVIAKRMLSNLLDNNLFNKTENAKDCWISICKTLSREFKVLYKGRAKVINPTDTLFSNHWEHLNYTLILNACCFVDGLDKDFVFKNINTIKEFLLNKDYINFLFDVSLLYDVLEKMHSKSIWETLLRQEFSKNYLMILAKYDTKNVYEIWQSQLDAIKPNEYGVNYLSDEVNSALISMPTSAGKSFIAELAIIKCLEKRNELKCIYVASTRALCSEVENNLFLRLRRLGFNVSAVFDTDENDYENELLNDVNVLVLTPEKLDLLIRRNHDLRSKIGLIVFDEFHKISNNSRGWLLETLISWFLINQNNNNYKILLMSAIVSNTTAINTWIGNDRFEPIKSSWSPSRRVYCVVSKHSRLKDTVLTNISENVQQIKVPYRLRYRYQDDIKEIGNIFYDYTTKITSKKGNVRIDYENSDTKFDRCYKLIKYLNDNKILIYFFTKDDLDSFISYSESYLEKKNTDSLRKLEHFLNQRLGAEHPLVRNIMYGVAYHHGDLPIEVRKEIEKSYRAGDIDILACTTTLSDGVNLPIKNFILGSFTTYESEFKLSIPDFKNIVGRAGRAYIDTEGRIFLIQHPEYLFGDTREYFGKLVYCEDQDTSVSSSMVESFDNIELVLNRLEEITEVAVLDIAKSTLDIIDRLQVFIFSMFEEYANNTLDGYEEFNDIFKKLLFVFQSAQDTERVQSFNNICNRYFSAASQVDKNTISKFNKTGLSFRSNRILKEIGEEISRNEDFSDFSIERYITREIFEKILSIKEIIPKVYKYKDGRTSVNYSIDHYEMFIQWINGNDFVTLRDSVFSEDRDISNRTQTCVNYINDMYLYKLPWAFSSLYVFVNDITIVLAAIVKNLSAIVKYGVPNYNAIKLCTLGMESRVLASRLADLYDSDDTKSDGDQIDKWISEKSFYYLENNVIDIDEISIKQISRVRTKLRRRTNELRDAGMIKCEIMGLPFYNYKLLYSEGQIDTETELRLVQEPENLYDEFAVRVETFAGEKIGYIPSNYAEEVYDFLEADHSLYLKTISSSRRKLVLMIST